MSKKTLDTTAIQNDLQQSAFFAKRRAEKEQQHSETNRTGEQVNIRAGEQVKQPLSEITVRDSFTIFIEQQQMIEQSVSEKKKAGKKRYSKSKFMREVLKWYFDKEIKAGRMVKPSAQVHK